MDICIRLGVASVDCVDTTAVKEFQGFVCETLELLWSLESYIRSEKLSNKQEIPFIWMRGNPAVNGCLYQTFNNLCNLHHIKM